MAGASARDAQARASRPGRRDHPSQPVLEEPPEKFRPLREYAERQARGLWVDLNAAPGAGWRRLRWRCPGKASGFRRTAADKPEQELFLRQEELELRLSVEEIGRVP
jgi:hypothetical protein